jgi:hypothetical protein
MATRRSSGVAAAATVWGGRVSSFGHRDARRAAGIFAIASALVLASTSCGSDMAYQHGDKMGSLWYGTGRGESQTYHWPAPVTGETTHWNPDSHAAMTEPTRHVAATTEPSPCATAPSEVEQPVKRVPSPDPRRAGVPTSSDTELVELVRRLGGASDPDPIASMSLWHLRAAPHRAVRRLVGEIRVVVPDRIDDDVRHVIWCVRALRLITGQNFQFNTATPLTANQCRLYRTCYG